MPSVEGQPECHVAWCSTLNPHDHHERGCCERDVGTLRKEAELRARLKPVEIKAARELLRANGCWVIRKPTLDIVVNLAIRLAAKA